MNVTGVDSRNSRVLRRFFWPALIAACLFLSFASFQPAAAGGNYDLTVVKQAWMPNGNDPYPFDWSFDIACTMNLPADCDDITLTDDVADHLYSYLQEYEDVTLTETVPDGWTASVSCENQNNVEIAGGNDSVTIDANDVIGGDEITCIFTNIAEPGTITIYKDADYEDDTEFIFWDNIEGVGFSLSDPSNNVEQFTDVPPGPYTVNENWQAGWALDNIICDDPDGGSTTGIEVGDVYIDLDPGEDISCTFYNKLTNLGIIHIDKVADPADDTAFDFNEDIESNGFTLSVPTTSSRSFNDVFPGDYTVSEDAVDGWTLDSIVCDDPDDGSTTDTGARTATIDLDPGEAVTCTFTNSLDRGTIVIVKEADPADDTVFSFTEDIVGDGFTLQDPSDKIRMFTDVLPGSYTVTEDTLGGWTLDDITCDDANSTGDTGTRAASIDLEAGETVTCTFTNSLDRGTIVIVKDADPADDTAFSFTEDIVGDGFTLQDPSDKTRMFTDVPAGQYTVTEDTLGGWTLDDITCDDANSTGYTDTRYAVINLEAGETVTCTFVNQAQAQVTISKVTDPAGGQDFPFTIDPGVIEFLRRRGGAGTDLGQLNSPSHVAVDGDGNVYVADFINNRVQKYDSEGTALLAWGWNVIDGSGSGSFEICGQGDVCQAGVAGSGDGQFNGPDGIAVSHDGYVYVVEANNNRVQKFTTAGAYVSQFGGIGSSAGQFGDPEGVAVDADGNVYVADNGNRRVQKFDSDGNFLLMWGKDVIFGGGTDFEICTPSDTCQAGTIDTGDGSFVTLTGVAVFGSSVYVADPFAQRIQVFTTAGVYVTKWGSSGSGNGQFDLPTDVAVDAAGNVYVADSQNDRVQKFDSAGNFLNKWGSSGGALGQFGSANAVAVNAAGHVWVSDSTNNYIQEFNQMGITLDDGQSLTEILNAPGTYVVSELVPDGWELTDIDCDGGDPSEDGNTVSVTLAPDDDVTCTFTNTEYEPPTGTIVIVKNATPADDTEFSFTTTITTTGFTLTDPSDNTEAFTDVPPGSYTVTEDTLGGWTLDDITCDDANSTGDTGTRAASIDLEAGETVTCTFTNSLDRGTIVIVKDADPADDTAFSFTEDIVGDGFTLQDPSDKTRMFTDVPAGQYTVTEQATAGWELTDLVCNDANSAEDLNARVATIRLEKDETVFCTFTNQPATPSAAGIFVSTVKAGTTGDGLPFGGEDIIRWDGSAWSTWFDGSAAGLTPTGKWKHNVNAFWIPDPSGDDVVISFTQNRRLVPGIVDFVNGMDLVWWDGTAFSMFFDGEDVGLTQMTPEKIDGLDVRPGSESPIGGSCLNYLLISTQGPGRVTDYNGVSIRFGGEDVLGFCLTNAGDNTAGFWHMVLDGSAQGMPRNSTDSISLSADGQTMYLTTQKTFNVDSAVGGHSMVYAYDIGTQTFSGPLFDAPANGLPIKVDGLQVEGDLP